MSEVELARARVRESIAHFEELLDDRYIGPVVAAAELISRSLRDGGKLIAFGNGGSSADAQHVAAELVGRFLLDRSPLAAVALSDNGATVTAVGNDYGFEHVFARQVRGLGRPGDVALAISTSGNSPNVLEAVRAAGEAGLTTIGLTGSDGGELRGVVDHCILVPADSTPRIQEAHSLVIHLLCEAVERQFAAGRSPST